MKVKAKLITAFALTGMLAACGENDEPEAVETGNENNNNNNGLEEEEDPLTVKTTLYPLTFFAEEIGGDLVDAETILPVGADAHTFEPSTNQMISIAEADLFLFNGAEFEGYAASIKDALEGEDVEIVEATEDMDLISFSHGISDDHDHSHDHNDDHSHNHDDHAHDDDHSHNDDHAHDDDHSHNDDHAHDDDHSHNDDHAHDDDHSHNHDDHSHGDYDPHVWLDPIRAIDYAEGIKEALINLMPEEEAHFKENFETLSEELMMLDEEFSAMVDEVNHDIIVVSHAGYGYWTDRYGIQQLGVAGLSPTNEPSIQQLQTIISQMDEYGVGHVMIEPNIPTNLIETVQDETGAETLRIHNLENLTDEDLENDEDYFSLMRMNIEALRTALE